MKINNYSLFSFALCVLKCVLSPPTIIGNGLILTVIIHHVKKTPSHVSVGFLACADLLTGFTPWFFLAMYLNTELLQNKVFCSYSAWLEAVLLALSATSKIIIACERCLLITNWQIHRRYLSVRRQIYVSVGIVIFALIVPTFSLLAGHVSPMYGNCYWALNTDKPIPNFVLIPAYLIFLFILIRSNLSIVHFVWKQKRKLVSYHSTMNQIDFRREKRTTALQAFIVTYCIILGLPIFIYANVIPKDPAEWQVQLLNILSFMYYITGVINPFIYALRVPDIQEGCHNICCRLIGKRRTNRVLPFHGTRGMNGSLQPRRDYTNFQNTSHEIILVSKAIKRNRIDFH